MQVTPEHPVYVEGKGWIWAENLAVGDRLRRADGGIARVLAIDRLALAAPEMVYNFTVKGPHTYFVLEVGVLVHNAGVTQCDFNLGSKRWQATEDVVINGKLYKKGQFIPAAEVYAPRRAGIDAEMERNIMENLPEGHVAVFRDRPLGAARYDSSSSELDAKRGWVKDWMLLKKHDGGIRELIDARKVRSGEYKHVTRGVGKNAQGVLEEGYNFQLKDGDPPVFVPDSYFEQFIPDNSPTLGHDNVNPGKRKLFGQLTVSDFDLALYANRQGALPDSVLLDEGEFADNFNRSYLDDLSEPRHLISHGAQVNIPPKIEAEMRKVPGRIEKIEAETVFVFANLPKIGKVGYVEMLPYKDAVEIYGQPWFWYPR